MGDGSVMKEGEECHLKMDEQINTVNHMVAINRMHSDKRWKVEREVIVVLLVSIVTAWPGWE